MLFRSNIVIDTTAPTISSVTPASSSTIGPGFSANYTLSEAVGSGTITFTRTGGSVDGATHIYNFGNGDKTSGSHSITRATLESGFGNSLVNGAVYTMTVSATDVALNAATPVSNTSITYDTTAPTISSVTPASSSTVGSGFSANYTLSEAVASGTITFTRTGGSADGATHIYNFASGDKTTGAHSITRATLESGFGNSLVNGAVYTMTVSATDAASNAATPVSNTLITYDTTPPDTNLDSKPTSPSNDPTAEFGFTSTETPSTFECQLDDGLWVGCESPQTYTGLSDGNHTFKVRATDAAGNTGDEVSYTWVIITSKPVISSVTPASSSTVGSGFTANYTLSKTVASGSITFTRTGG